MAQRKKRAAARRRKAATRGKARKPAKSVRGKAAKRTSAKAPTVETVIVDMIEEPVPGVMVVTEFEATGIRGPKAKAEQPEQSRGAAPPESKER